MKLKYQSHFQVNYVFNSSKIEIMSENITTVKLEKSPTELFKILKFEGIASSGAEAKMFIADGQVKVNGETELQKRKKIVAGDTINFADQTLNITE